MFRPQDGNIRQNSRWPQVHMGGDDCHMSLEGLPQGMGSGQEPGAPRRSPTPQTSTPALHCITKMQVTSLGRTSENRALCFLQQVTQIHSIHTPNNTSLVLPVCSQNSVLGPSLHKQGPHEMKQHFNMAFPSSLLLFLFLGASVLQTSVYYYVCLKVRRRRKGRLQCGKVGLQKVFSGFC